MLRLRKCILCHILAPSPAAAPIPPILSLHRLLSATPIPFPAVDYLVSNCGLSREQALKAAKKLSHLKSPSKPDAVLAFLAGLGLSRAEVATVVSRDPLFLCANVEKTLAPRVVELTDLGLSPPEIARLVQVSWSSFRSSSLGRNVGFWRQALGSTEELLRVVKFSSGILGVDLEKRAKPNLALLQGCGMKISEIPTAYMHRMVTVSVNRLQEALACVDEFGIERDSPIFCYALAMFAILSKQKLDKNIQLFEKLGWSRDNIELGVRRMPHLLSQSEEKIRSTFEFLTRDVGLEIPYIAQKPALMLYSLERRLVPRHCLVKFLKAKGLLRENYSFYSIATMGNERMHRFVNRYEEKVPGLAAAFASSCSSKHPWEHLCKKTGNEKLLTL